MEIRGQPHSPGLLTSRKETRYAVSTEKRLGGTKDSMNVLQKRKKYLLIPGFEPQIVHLLA